MNKKRKKIDVSQVAEGDNIKDTAGQTGKPEELSDAMQRVEDVRNELMDEGYDGLAEELNQAFYSLQILQNDYAVVPREP